MSSIFAQFFLSGVSGPTGRQPVARAVPGGFAADNNGGHPVGGMRRGSQTPGRGRLPRRNRRGLIGMLLTIVVAVVIVIAIFAAYNQVTASSSAAQTAIFVRQLAPQISNEYRGNYTGLTEATAISSGFVPDNWKANNNTIKDPNGRVVEIAGTATNFTVTIVGGVPSQTCKAVLGALKSDPTFVGVKVGGGQGAAVEARTQQLINRECGKDGNFAVTFR